MTSFPTLLRQQIEDELGPRSQVPSETQKTLRMKFARDMESKEYKAIMEELTEEEREEIQALLHSLSHL